MCVPSWIIELAPKGIRFIYRRRKDLAAQYRMMMRRYFYSERMVSRLIWSFNGSEIKNDEFINYKTVFEGNIYPTLGVDVKVKWRDQLKTVRLPYVMCTDFTAHPESGVFLSQAGPVLQLYPADDLCSATKKNLNAYLGSKRQVYDDPILCMTRLEKNSPYRLTCDVGWTHFAEIIRTNLTLDYPLEGGYGSTLRKQEAALAGGGLPAFEHSHLMNFIGVSAVWCMDRGYGAPEKRYLYYLKCRRKGLSVYTGMTGTVSGYVNPPAGNRFEDPDLMKFLKSEILREFDEETGYGEYAKRNGFSLNDEKQVKVTPLAFTRELMRGGCPQFFFLIQTPYISDKDFVSCFKGSLDGENEFRDDTLSNRMNHPLSPETLMNLLYAYKWMQREYCLDFIKIEL